MKKRIFLVNSRWNCYKSKNLYIQDQYPTPRNMDSMYQNLCKEYPAGSDFMEAVRLNKAQVYYILSRLIIQNCAHFRMLNKQQGPKAADQVLTAILMAFHRQVKERKVEISIRSNGVSVNRENQDLLAYLSGLFQLGWEVSPFHSQYSPDREIENKLIQGQGFSKLLVFRDMISHTLQVLGCRDSQDREEIFDESLLIFWKKISSGEIGICSSGRSGDIASYRVFHRKLLLCSKLSTFLTGISRNLFMNRTRTAAFQNNINTVSDLPEQEAESPMSAEFESPAFMLYLYYRTHIDERGLRALISILQYDCSLEDKEVKQLLGIQNARIHSCRLRAGFAEWYSRNLPKVPELLDSAQEYLSRRQAKTQFLNCKISCIDLYRRSSLPYLDLSCFREEFRSIPEFRQYHLLFLTLFYFVSTGKASSLTGLPDETRLRQQMQSYKEVILGRGAGKALLFLLYYGSDEPSDIIRHLLESLIKEPEVNQGNQNTPGSSKGIAEWIPADNTSLTDLLYTINRTYFEDLRIKPAFIKPSDL